MADRYRPITLRPTDGGVLTAPPVAPATAGAANYVEKLNLRREEAGEVRREGRLLFLPVEVVPGNQPLNADGPVTMIVQFARPNGRSALVAAAGSKLYRFYPPGDLGYVEEGYVEEGYVSGAGATGVWNEIATGLATVGVRRWQAEALNGYLILNNAVDIPLVYREEWSAVRPLYELREQCIASVGGICVVGTYLFCFDIVEIPEDRLPVWFANAAEPYGRCDAAAALAAGVHLQRTHYKSIWGHPAEPTRWAVVVPGANLSGSQIFVMAFAAQSFAPAQEVVIVGGGVSGGNLVTTIAQVASDGRTLTLAAATSTAGTAILAADMVGSPAGQRELTDDSARILAAVEFRARGVFFTEGGYHVATQTGNPEDAWRFEKFYDDTEKSGRRRGRVPHFPNTLCTFNDVLAFISFSGPWYVDLRTAEPQPLGVLRTGPQFWKTIAIDQVEQLFAADNALTNEIWFCTPEQTVALDYAQVTLSVIDEVYTAAAMMRRPEFHFAESADLWFVLGMADGKLYRYGLGHNFACYHRNGAGYVSRLRHGHAAFGDTYNEKTVRGWVLGHEHRLGIFFGGGPFGEQPPSFEGGVLPLPLPPPVVEDPVITLPEGEPQPGELAVYNDATDEALSEYDFGDYAVGSSVNVVLRLANEGDGPLAITGLIMAIDGMTLVGAPALPALIAPAGSLTFSVRFAPTVAGTAQGSLRIESSDLNSPRLISLRGDALTNWIGEALDYDTPVEHAISATTSGWLGEGLKYSTPAGESVIEADTEDWLGESLDYPDPEGEEAITANTSGWEGADDDDL